MKIFVSSTDNITKMVGDRFAAQLRHKPTSVLGMTTGSTPLTLGIFKDWIRRVEEGEMDFSQATIINPDELLGIPSDHPESYKTYLEKHLFQSITVARDKIHVPSSQPDDPVAECHRFDSVIEAAGGIDLQLMGLGLNGHICFIEPARSLPYSTYVVQLEQSSRPPARHFSSEEDVPDQAISIGIGVVMNARAITLVAVGENKADVVEKAFVGPITTEVPASFLQLHKDVTIYLDEVAAAKLPSDMYERL